MQAPRSRGATNSLRRLNSFQGLFEPRPIALAWKADPQILGPFLEKSLRTSLEMSAGDFSIFFTRPLCLVLLVLAAVVLVASALRLPPRALREASST